MHWRSPRSQGGTHRLPRGREAPEYGHWRACGRGHRGRARPKRRRGHGRRHAVLRGTRNPRRGGQIQIRELSRPWLPVGDQRQERFLLSLRVRGMIRNVLPVRERTVVLSGLGFITALSWGYMWYLARDP